LNGFKEFENYVSAFFLHFHQFLETGSRAKIRISGSGTCKKSDGGTDGSAQRHLTENDILREVNFPDFEKGGEQGGKRDGVWEGVGVGVACRIVQTSSNRRSFLAEKKKDKKEIKEKRNFLACWEVL